jgi:trafficking protein particle complex subunit 6
MYKIIMKNHRGVFVLKDLELKWLTRYPPNTEHSRVTAIRLLAFPCGIIRGVLSNLGIPAVVSCDFLADGSNMAACSFNIKVK